MMTMKHTLLAAAVLLAGMDLTAEPQERKTPQSKAAPVMKRYVWNLADAGGFGGPVSKFDIPTKTLNVTLSSRTDDWAGVNLGDRIFNKNPDKFPGWNDGFLVFEMSGGPNRKGKLCPLSPCQIILAHRNANGKIEITTDPVPFLQFAPKKTVYGDRFAIIRVPLKLFSWKKGDSRPMNLILIQFCGGGKTAGGFSVRSMRFEIPEK